MPYSGRSRKLGIKDKTFENTVYVDHFLKLEISLYLYDPVPIPQHQPTMADNNLAILLDKRVGM
jgi:hypothetical protein